jgi:RNA polymerase sigma-70 factor (ECF subfamily)
LKSLIEKAKRGDAESFEKIYKLVYSPLYRYIYSRTHTKEVTEDILQQVFLRFFEALPRFTLSEDIGLMPYLFTISKRLIINEGVRKKTIRLEDEEFELIPDEDTDTFSQADIRLLAEKINEYLPELSDDEEDVIRLFFYAELSHKEVAEVLAKDEAHVRKLKERALRKLRTLTKHLHA